MAKGKDVTAFRAAHDKSFTVPQALEKGLKELGDGWEYESEFMKRCKLSPADFAAHTDPFRDAHTLTVQTPGTSRRRVVWCGTPKFAKQLRSVTRVVTP